MEDCLTVWLRYLSYLACNSNLFFNRRNRDQSIKYRAAVYAWDDPFRFSLDLFDH